MRRNKTKFKGSLVALEGLTRDDTVIGNCHSMLKKLVKIFLLVIIVSAFFAVPVHAKKTVNDATGECLN